MNRQPTYHIENGTSCMKSAALLMIIYESFVYHGIEIGFLILFMLSIAFLFGALLSKVKNLF